MIKTKLLYFWASKIISILFFIFKGMRNNQTEKKQGKRVVLDLVKDLPFGYDVKTDNFFTSLKLALELLTLKQILTGTVRKNRRKVPKEILPDKTRERQSSIFLRTKEAIMVSYMPKRKKAVVLFAKPLLGKIIHISVTEI